MWEMRGGSHRNLFLHPNPSENLEPLPQLFGAGGHVLSHLAQKACAPEIGAPLVVT
jgi:hypothetical protein